MIDVNIDGTLPEKVDRIPPQLSVNQDGTINWTPAYTDHNVAAFFRGKTLSPEEYNAALVKQIVQANYLSDSLSDFFNKQLGTVIYNNFINKFNLERSYIKTFFEEDWGEQQEDGYWYLTIPASEHGFELASEDQDIYERMNIDANMYLLDHNGKFKEVTQVDVDTQNTVRLFTDDPTLTGFVVVRTNDKAYALAEGYIQAHQLTGLANVATSGKFNDLVDINAADGPNTKIRANAARIQYLIDGKDADDNPLQVYKAHLSDIADTATYASRIEPEGYMNDVLISEIFDGPASSIVKQATKATDVDVINQNTNDDAEIRFRLGNGIGFSKTINHVDHANNATNATNVNTTKLDSADDIIKFRLGNGSIFEKQITNVNHAYNAGTLVEGGSISSSVTGTTQDIEDDSNKIATTAFVQRIREEVIAKLQRELSGSTTFFYTNANGTTSITVDPSTFNNYELLRIDLTVRHWTNTIGSSTEYFDISLTDQSITALKQTGRINVEEGRLGYIAYNAGTGVLSTHGKSTNDGWPDYSYTLYLKFVYASR